MGLRITAAIENVITRKLNPAIRRSMKPIIIKIPFIVPDNTYPLFARFEELIGDLDDIPKGVEYHHELYKWFGKVNEERERLDNEIDAIIDDLHPDMIELDFFLCAYAYKLEQLKDRLDNKKILNGVERTFVEDKINRLMKRFDWEYNEVDSDGVNVLGARIGNLKLLKRNTK